MDKIKEHYQNLAKIFGSSMEMSMEDNFTKESEIKDIISNLKYFTRGKFSPSCVLELGCGNGYTANAIHDVLNIDYIGVDFCEELVALANERNIDAYKFITGDALDLKFDDGCFDIIFSERCLINLITWEQQKKSIDEIYRVLKTGGIYIMIECFTDGLNNINAARKSLGLDEIQQKFHNRYFDKCEFMDYIKDRFIIYDESHPTFSKSHNSNFLSTYYFGRSVVYPALAHNQNLTYNNKFVEFFEYLQPVGNYSYIQSFIFEKV